MQCGMEKDFVVQFIIWCQNRFCIQLLCFWSPLSNLVQGLFVVDSVLPWMKNHVVPQLSENLQVSLELWLKKYIEGEKGLANFISRHVIFEIVLKILPAPFTNKRFF